LVSPQATTHTHQYAPMECAVCSALWLSFPSGNDTPTNMPLWSAPSVRRFGLVSPQATTHPPIRPYGVRRPFGALAQFPLRQLHTPTNTPL
jgi:hypothetical protein